MTHTWFRTTPMGYQDEKNVIELWSNGDGHSYDVSVRFGKPMDLLNLKRHDASRFQKHAQSIHQSRSSLYSGDNLELVRHCPVCDAGDKDSALVLRVMGAAYHQCRRCGHVYVIARPSQAALDEFYAGNRGYASYYADPETTRLRVEQIAKPKLEWLLETYQAKFGRLPRKIVDVGAGAGHFVYACRQAGVEAVGIELSETAAAFAQMNFGVSLHPVDFLESARNYSETDIITFWGLIEHTTQPVKFLEMARSIVSGCGMVATEVPRWTSIATAVQREFPDTITRHLDPLGHINVFTDSSLLTAFSRAGWAPLSAWYYGMDAYELMTQTGIRTGDSGGEWLEKVGHSLLNLQEWIDRAQLTDEIILAGCPE